MAEKLVNIDRNTPMLLPPDLRDWIEDDDIVHFVLDVTVRVSSEHAHVNRRGTGSAQYPPSMMLALLLYCYTQGIYSSRKIEKASYSNISVRYLTANHHPDHDTIATFRRKNKDFIKQAFVTTVQVARELGFSKLGTMAVDGTSLRANAGKKTTMRYGDLEQQVDSLCEETMRRADEADNRDGDKKQALPSKERVEKALSKIRKTHKIRKDRRKAMRQEVKKGGMGSLPHELPDKIPNKKYVNLADPDCHYMPMKEGYYSPGYNAQLAVDTQTLLITAALISTSSIDNHQLLPVTAESHHNCGGSVHTVVADSGYDNNHQINELEKRHGVHAVVCVKDPHRLSTKHTQNKRRQRARKLKLKRMEELATPRGKKLLKERRSSVETVFGTIKHAMQFRGFLQRGENDVANEWNLITTAFNLKRLMNMGATS